MDKFVTVTKPATRPTDGTGSDKQKKHFKYNPYPIPKAKERQIEAWRDKKRTEKVLGPLCQEKSVSIASTTTMTRHLLNTLKDEANPITHSTIRQRPDHVDSCTTGHQRSDVRRPSGYFKSRSKKLEEQRQQKLEGEDTNRVLEGIKIYIGGYMAGTTDIEMKRIITLSGGKMMHMAAGATHILTSQGLSSSKTHKLLHGCARNKVHVVSPRWVLDSIALGKRQKEWDYTVVKDSTTYHLGEYSVGSSGTDKS